MIYAGLAHTTAARMVVFVYLAPCLTALGLSIFVPGERLAPLQWLGVAMAFCGIAFAFHDGFVAPDRATLARRSAAAQARPSGWAATTVLIRATSLARDPRGEDARSTSSASRRRCCSRSRSRWASRASSGSPRSRRRSLLYQSLIVAFASYLTWFWLLTRYLANRLSVFSFATPLFGVAFGHLVLGDPITPAFLAAAALVGAGILLVNAKRG